MAQLLNPITSRDFSAGRITKFAVSPALVPANSVANSLNVDYSEIIGSGIVRKGKQSLSVIVANSTSGQTFTNKVDGDEQAFDGANWSAQTFTPTSGQSQTVGITVRLYRVGTSTGDITLSLRTTSGGNPTATLVNGNSFTLAASSIGTGTSGTNFTFILNPGTVLSSGTKYAIVISYASGDGSHYIQWMRNQAGSVTGADIRASTDSGATWGTGGSGEYYFIQLIVDTSSTYNTAPLGNYGFLISSVGRNVVAYNDPLNGTGVIFYYDVNSGSWKVSNLITLNSSAKVRFAVMNGSVFEANGADAMHDSVDFGATWGTTNSVTTDSVIPSLLIVSNNRMLASGYSTYPSRVYFSSVVDPSTSPFITWNTNASTGDWIDINPDEGGIVTGFVNTASLTLVFKTNGMYRLNTISKSVNPENIYNVGAVSQEAIVNCLGLTYFYSGNGIYQTDGTFPTQISRIGVQDFVDAIQSKTSVYAGTDGFNVYFSLGPINVTFGQEDQRTFTNVVLKFSPRDQNWQIYTYDVRQGQYTQINFTSNVPTFVTAQYNGKIAEVNSSTSSDDSSAIPYELETQEQEFGNRSHTKQISDEIVVYTKFGGEGNLAVKQDDGNFKSADMTVNNRVNVGQNVDYIGHFFTFQWKGEANGSRPIFEGYHLPKVTDLGIIEP